MKHDLVSVSIHDDAAHAVDAFRLILAQIPHVKSVISVCHDYYAAIHNEQLGDIVLQDVMYTEEFGGEVDSEQELLDPTGLKIALHLVNEKGLEPHKIIIIANLITDEFLKFVYDNGLSLVYKDTFEQDIAAAICVIVEEKTCFRSKRYATKIKQNEASWQQQHDILSISFPAKNGNMGIYNDMYKVMYMRLAGQTYSMVVNILLLEQHKNKENSDKLYQDYTFKNWLFHDQIADYLCFYLKLLREFISEKNATLKKRQEMPREQDISWCKNCAEEEYAASVEGKRMPWDKLKEWITKLENAANSTYISLAIEEQRIVFDANCLFERKMASVHSGKNKAVKALKARGLVFEEMIELYWLLRSEKNPTIRDIEKNMGNLLG
ncbi:MAG: hypothetical protein ACKVTZ_15060 [Bacteroidia bacterium]